MSSPCGLCPLFPHSFLFSFPVFPVMEDVDYGAITGIHIGKKFDLFHLNPTDIGQGTSVIQDNKLTHIEAQWWI